MHLGEIISAIALAMGAALGMGALVSPAWASKVVRLVEDPDPARPGGFSEFRATFGGLFLFAHMMTLVLLLAVSKTPDTPGFLAILVVMPIAAGWIGAGFGRAVSLLVDKDKNRAPGMIPVWIPMELVTGLVIAAPLLQFLV